MGIISVPPLHNLSRISEENITDNRVRRQSAKAKDSVMPEIELNNSAVGATRRVEEKKSYAEVAKIAKRANPITLLFFVILLFLLPQLDKKELTTSAIRSDPDTPVTSPPGGTS